MHEMITLSPDGELGHGAADLGDGADTLVAEDRGRA